MRTLTQNMIAYRISLNNNCVRDSRCPDIRIRSSDTIRIRIGYGSARFLSMIEGTEQAGPSVGTSEEIPQPVQGQVEEAVAAGRAARTRAAGRRLRLVV